MTDTINFRNSRGIHLGNLKLQIQRRIINLASLCLLANKKTSKEIEKKNYQIQTISTDYGKGLQELPVKTSISRVQERKWEIERQINPSIYEDPQKQLSSDQERKRQIQSSQDQKFFSNSNLQIQNLISTSSMPSSIISCQGDTFAQTVHIPSDKSSRNIIFSNKKSQISSSFIQDLKRPLVPFNKLYQKCIYSSRLTKNNQKKNQRIIVSQSCKFRMKLAVAKATPAIRRQANDNKVRINLLKRIADKSRLEMIN